MTRQVESRPHAVGCAPTECGDPAHVISVTYLGVAGLLIEHNGHVMLTAPFFSNPSLRMVMPRATRLLRSTPRISADTVAKIYSGPSVRHMLMGDSALRANGGERVVAISAAAIGRKERRGVWYYSADSAYRFMALAASHAPTYRAWRQVYTFTSGSVDVDLDSLPHTAAEWKLGEPYAFIIDVLSDRTRAPLFRIYFEDAPSEPPLGFPPTEVLAERPIDLAVICAATSSNVSNTPDSLLTVLKPSQVILAHWEDFFRPQTLPIQLSPATDLDAIRESLRKSLPRASGWVLPLPQTTLRFKGGE